MDHYVETAREDMRVFQWVCRDGVHYPADFYDAICTVICISRKKRQWRIRVALFNGIHPVRYEIRPSLKAAKDAAESWLIQLKLEGKI